MFILLDEVQFIRHGWIERNRILKPAEGWQYFQVPLKNHSRDVKIKEIVIDNQQNWKDKIIAQLLHYKKKSSYYLAIMDLLHDIFLQEYTDIVSLNNAILIVVCNYLEIKTPIKIFSEMGIAIDPVNSPDEWALNICKAMKSNEYWNPPGGMSFFNRVKFDVNHVSLYFHKSKLVEYDQKRAGFEPGLSIIDVMMFNSPELINQMLNEYELL